jgi:flavodoxin
VKNRKAVDHKIILTAGETAGSFEMRRKFVFVRGVICILLLAACQSVPQTGQQNSLGKVLILYYTWSDQANTEKSAKIIQGLTNADMIKVEPVTPFPDLNTEDMIAWVGEQREKQVWPEIKDLGIDPASYDFIFIGTPVWYLTVSLPIESLLLKMDFGNKPVACFAMANSTEGEVLNNFKKQVKNGQVREGIAFRMQTETQVETKITQWVNGLRK